MAYRVQLNTFEGPLDLLLSLIEKEELDITQVSLASVADQYLEYLKQEESISLGHLASFLSVAARLILIKSRALLPVLDFSQDEEEAMGDLENRLKIYREFRDAARRLGSMMRRNRYSYSRESYLGAETVFYPPSGLTAASLREHFLRVLGDIPEFEDLPEQELARVVTLQEKILSLRETLWDRAEISFADIAGTTADRTELIVSFLAVLELVKQKWIEAEQEDFFGRIRIRRTVSSSSVI